jgi:hypothetical protein
MRTPPSRAGLVLTGELGGGWAVKGLRTWDPADLKSALTNAFAFQDQHWFEAITARQEH